MGKSLPSSTTLHNYVRIMSSSERITPRFPKKVNPTPSHKPSPSKNSQPSLGRVEPVRVDPARVGLKMDNSAAGRARVPLAAVVSNCVRRWFQDTLAEARAGDSGMQLLVGQMYNTGYGVRKDTEKGRTWIARASKGRSSAWNVSDKQPGYNASDSESEDVKDCRS